MSKQRRFLYLAVFVCVLARLTDHYSSRFCPFKVRVAGGGRAGKTKANPN